MQPGGGVLEAEGRTSPLCLQLQVESWRLAHLSSLPRKPHVLGVSVSGECVSMNPESSCLSSPLNSNVPCTGCPKCVGWDRLNVGMRIGSTIAVIEEVWPNLDRGVGVVGWTQTLPEVAGVPNQMYRSVSIDTC